MFGIDWVDWVPGIYKVLRTDLEYELSVGIETGSISGWEYIIWWWSVELRIRYIIILIINNNNNL
jgi:hypothetical protein